MISLKNTALVCTLGLVKAHSVHGNHSESFAARNLATVQKIYNNTVGSVSTLCLATQQTNDTHTNVSTTAIPKKHPSHPVPGTVHTRPLRRGSGWPDHSHRELHRFPRLDRILLWARANPTGESCQSRDIRGRRGGLQLRVPRGSVERSVPESRASQ